MTASASEAGRPGDTRAAGQASTSPAGPVARLVTRLCLLGGLLALAVVLLLPHRGSVLRGVGLPEAWLLPGLIVLTFLAAITVVRLRHGDAVEALSLYEAALIIDVLLLPPRQALLAAVLGLVVALVVQRRPTVKILFNLGNFTTAVSALIMVVHAVGGTPGRLNARVLAGVVLGSVAFTVVNLVCMAAILSIVTGDSRWSIIRSEARLSAYMATGTLATGLTTTAIGLYAPLLLPFMAMPALAATYAYRTVAQEADERARSACLLKVSHALAEHNDLERRFLHLVRDAFGVDLATIVLDRADIALTADAQAPGELSTGPVPHHLIDATNVDTPTFVVQDLPADIRQVLVVPLEAGDRRFGAVALAVRGRRARLSTRDVTLLAPLANALAVAMRGSEHLDRLIEETSKLHAIVEQSTEGIFMVGGDGRVQMWSRAIAELTEVSNARASGRRLVDLIEVPDPAERGWLLPVTPEHPRATVEITIRRPGGEFRRVRLAHSAIFTGGTLVRDVVVVRDMTREHRTERLKSDFIATVSHELRTPLTPILGYLHLLRTRGDRLSEQKRRNALALIADRAAHMSRLVEDLLLASRMGDADDDLTPHVSVGTHDLAVVVRQVVNDLGTPRITAELPGHPVPVVCDFDRALQVTSNLIGNALKYSAETEAVRVSMRRDDDHVHVDVSDRGRGIPADELEQVFEKFHRVEDPMTMSTSGTGLGLFISRRLARAMGGNVTVSSALNVGSVFTFTLRRGDHGQHAGAD
ncbi:PAS domain-containing protein [Dactylosporangium roseum]|uniref:Sensor-like histidine kinase SenX3 n=1 Tax=Dactylosporangium roseum TaxID=47989 RepID=A0ABY5YVL7_9ACTN|nr:ATP-binding protein [Dactylosporangium roseum]UWZ33421.1 PAS domain-containing protein [Dactylosporangium roseum]